VKLSDTHKLLEWLDAKADAKHFGAVYAALIEVFKEIQSGTFDDHSAQEEIAKLKKERDEAISKLYDAEQTIEHWEMTLLRWREEERNALLEGLKWYADKEKNYTVPFNGPFRAGNENVINDGGKRARSIIAKVEGSKPNKGRYTL
jgi:hypothetical protein